MKRQIKKGSIVKIANGSQALTGNSDYLIHGSTGIALRKGDKGTIGANHWLIFLDLRTLPIIESLVTVHSDNLEVME